MKFKEYLRWRTHQYDEIELHAMALGINSSVDATEDLHIVMLDYDTKDLQKVIRSVEEVQQFWQLADAYVFRTQQGYHVYFWFDQLPYERVRQIVDFARSVDPMFKYISKYYSHKTLRVSGKYKYRDIWFERIISGVRKPTFEEVELGTMKYDEYRSLCKIIVQQSEVL